MHDDDILIHLGDVIIGGYNDAKRLLDSIPGRKILIMGNHDRSKSKSWWMRNGFDTACDGMMFHDAWLSHEPAPFLPHGATVNIHGHLHIQRRSWKSLKPWHKLFLLEYVNYTPVEFQKFLDMTSVQKMASHSIPW